MQQERAIKVVLMMAQTVDGIIARDPNHYTEWTCSSDKRLFKRITQEAGVLIMGARTYATIGKPLPGRLNVVYTRHPERLPQGENVLFSQKPPGDLLDELSRKGYSRVILTGGATINTLFAREQLIDEILITVSPQIFGQGLNTFSEPLDMNVTLVGMDKLDRDTVLLHYMVVRNGSDRLNS